MPSSFYTRCPDCSTVFKVPESHLKSAHGKVRCGACMTVFNATLHLVKPKQHELHPRNLETPSRPLDEGSKPTPDLKNKQNSLREKTKETLFDNNTKPSPSQINEEHLMKASIESEFEIHRSKFGDKGEPKVSFPIDSWGQETEQSDKPSDQINKNKDDHRVDKTNADKSIKSEPKIDLPIIESPTFIDQEKAKEIHEFSSAKEANFEPSMDDVQSFIDQLSQDDESIDGDEYELERHIEEELVRETNEKMIDDNINLDHFSALPESDIKDSDLNASSPLKQTEIDAGSPNTSTRHEKTDNTSHDKNLEQTTLLRKSKTPPPYNPEGSKIDGSLAQRGNHEVTTEPFEDEFIEQHFSPAETKSEQIALALEEAAAPTLLSDPLNNSDFEPDPLDEFEDIVNKKNHQLKWLIASVAVLISLSWGAWSTWTKRQELAWHSTWGSTVQTMCDYLPCELKPRRSVADIELIQRNVQPNDDQPNHADFSLIIRNNALFVQPYPTIEIHFTDNSGNQIATEVFSPNDYLPLELRDTMMPVNQKVHVLLTAKSQVASSSGFEFRFL